MRQRIDTAPVLRRWVSLPIPGGVICQMVVHFIIWTRGGDLMEIREHNRRGGEGGGEECVCGCVGGGGEEVGKTGS